MNKSPGVPSPGSARALAGQSNVLARQDALGHLDIEHALLRYQSALGVYFRDAQGQLPRAAPERGVQIEQHFRMMVLTASRMERTASIAGSCARSRAEQRLEKIAVGRIAGRPRR